MSRSAPVAAIATSIACLLALVYPHLSTATDIRDEMTTIGGIGSECSYAQFAGPATPALADTFTTLVAGNVFKWSGAGTSHVQVADTSNDWVKSSVANEAVWCYEPFEQEPKAFLVQGSVDVEITAAAALYVLYVAKDGVTALMPTASSYLEANATGRLVTPLKRVVYNPGDCAQVYVQYAFGDRITTPRSYYMTFEEIECHKVKHYNHW